MTALQQLGIVDGAFLHLESAEMPMHVGSLAIYDPPAQLRGSWFDAVKAHIAGRMHLAPVFTRKLASLPLAYANPVWITDTDIDLDHHIRHHVLPQPGTMEQLEALAARLHAQRLDRSRPLWEFHVIDGLADGRTGLYSKVHHAAVDGQAAVALAASLFDVSPQPREVAPPRSRPASVEQPGTAELIAASLSNQWLQLRRFAKLLPPLASAALATVRSAAGSKTGRHPGKPSGSRLKLAPPSPFNEQVSEQRVFAAVALPMAPLKAIGKAHGASINDMVIWLCSTALREHLLEIGKLPERTLVAFVPISLRAGGDTSSNNQVSMTVVDLATQLEDPLQRLAAITAATRTMKGEIDRFGDLIPKDFPSLGAPWLIGGLASLYARTGIANRLRIANLVISNVPGPQMPMYLAGARLTGMFPLSIVVHGVGLNITVQSYLGQLCFGMVACGQAMADAQPLADSLRRAMDIAAALPLPPSPSPGPEHSTPPPPARKRKPRGADAGAAVPGKQTKAAKRPAVPTPGKRAKRPEPAVSQGKKGRRSSGAD